LIVDRYNSNRSQVINLTKIVFQYEILNSDDEDEVKDKAVGQDFISKLPHKASNRVSKVENI
jgi:hypothetical protein